MGGAASILFWCAAVRRFQAWSARCSGALVWARLSAASPAGAGGWGRWGARCAGTAAPPPPRVAVPPGGGGASPRLWGRRGSLLWPSSLGGGAGGGWGGRPPAPLPRQASACHPLSPACPPGVYSCRAGCRAAAGVGRGRPPMGQCGGGGGEGGGVPPPWFAPLSSPGRPLKGPLRLRRLGRRRSAVGRQRAGRAGVCLGRGAPSPGVGRPLWGGVRGCRFFGLPPSALGPEGEGGGSGGRPLVPWHRPLTAEGGAAWRSRPRGPAVSWGVALFLRPPLPRVRPSCRPSLGPLFPPAVVARRSCEG